MKTFLLLVLLAVASADELDDKYKSIKAAWLKSVGLGDYVFDGRLACLEEKLLTRPPHIEAKIKELIDMFIANNKRHEELVEDPNKFNMEVFHEKCPMYKEKAVGLATAVNELVQSCRSEDPETKPIVIAFFVELFDYVCGLEKDQLISLFDKRAQNYYQHNSEAIRKCVPAHIPMEPVSRDGFCGFEYKDFFGCLVNVYDSVTADQKPAVNFSRWLLKFLDDHCNTV